MAKPSGMHDAALEWVVVIKTGEGLARGGGVNNSLDMARPVLTCAGSGVVRKRNFSLQCPAQTSVVRCRSGMGSIYRPGQQDEVRY